MPIPYGSQSLYFVWKSAKHAVEYEMKEKNVPPTSPLPHSSEAALLGKSGIPFQDRSDQTPGSTYV